jgi:GNAT superfamily N-acetyltransferase
MQPLRTTIRFALEGDANALAELRWASRSLREQASESKESFVQRFVQWLSHALRSEDWQIAVAQPSGGPLIGCMYLRVIETVPVPGIAGRAWGYVTHAFVQEGARGDGVGTALLAQLIHRSRSLQLHELQVWPSAAAVSLYARAGFQSPEAQRASGEEASYLLPLPAR